MMEAKSGWSDAYRYRRWLCHRGWSLREANLIVQIGPEIVDTETQPGDCE